MALCQFVPHANGGLVCPVCQRKVRRWCIANCPGSPIVKTPDYAILARLNAVGRARLARCKTAHCPLLIQRAGQSTCSGMPGGPCEWIAHWANSLNGTKPFPNGTEDCPHWKPLTGEDSKQRE
jgi:hypothetical protein